MRRTGFWLDIALVGIIIGFGVFTYVDSWTIRPGFRQVLGADAYPRFLSQVLLALCALYIANQLVTGLRTKATAAGAEASEGAAGEDSAEEVIPLFQDWKQAGNSLALMWLSFLGYLIGIPLIGYFLCSFIFLWVAIYGLGEKGAAWLRSSALYAAGITLALWLVLDRILGIYLPPARLLAG